VTLRLRVSCPSCQSAFKVAEHDAGKHGKCPKCGTRFAFSTPSTPDQSPPAIPGHELSPATPPSLSSFPGGSQSQTPSPTPTSSPVTGFFRHAFTKGHRFHWSTTVAATLASLLIGYFLGREHIKYEIGSAIFGAGKAFSEGLQGSFGKGFQGPVAQASKPEPAVVPPPDPEKKGNEWVVAPIPARLGDVEVKVLSAKVAPPVTSRGQTGEGESGKPQLILTVEVSNRSQNRKIEYQTWAGAEMSFERDYATLEDNFANSYKRIRFGIFDGFPVGRVHSDSIYPGKSLSDVLVFEPPLEKFQHLDLEMPARNVGTEGLFKIRIPAAMIKR